MSDNLVCDTATRIFLDLCGAPTINDAEAGKWPHALWRSLEEMGLPLTWVPEGFGGAGAEVSDGFDVLRAAGRFAAPIPLAETLLAGWLLAKASIQVPTGPMTVAPVHCAGRIEVGGNGKIYGRARRVPFGRNASHIALLGQRLGSPVVALVKSGSYAVTPRANLAGEPNDEIVFDGAVAIEVQPAPSLSIEVLMQMGAAVRAQQMAGALERVLEQSIQYAMDRSQFGRMIGKFQVVQHNLAILAAEVAAAGVAADAAAESIAANPNDGKRSEVAVAIAKVRVGEAATTGSAIAHQVHGAIGFTYEHSLHHTTRRLWAWREEFGNEAFWAIRIGRFVAAQGADALWPFLTAGL